MPAPALIADIAPTVFTRAGVAYVHYLSFMLCFGALVLERRLIQPNPNRKDATLMVITDVVYGMAALALLVSGILRVMYFGQGSEFYTENPLFCGRSASTSPWVASPSTQRSPTSPGPSPCAKVSCPR